MMNEFCLVNSLFLSTLIIVAFLDIIKHILWDILSVLKHRYITIYLLWGSDWKARLYPLEVVARIIQENAQYIDEYIN